MAARVLVPLTLIFVLILLAQRASAAAEEEQLRTWTDRTGKHRTEASFVELKDGKVALKKKDGTTKNVPLESLSDTDQEYVEQRAAEKITHDRASNSAGPVSDEPDGQSNDPSEATDPSVAEINPSGGNKSSHAASLRVKEVVVTGVGTEPDKAVQNAFSQAIEQTVGLLVDAETVVKNDQLIRDEILTYSRGYVEKYEIVKRSEEGGLHHATIRAVVARDKLVERLREISTTTLGLSPSAFW